MNSTNTDYDPRAAVRTLVAIVLALLCPGLGHWFRGRPLDGLWIMLLVCGAYFISLPLCLLLHLAGVAAAAAADGECC